MDYYRLTLTVGVIVVVGAAVAGGFYFYRTVPQDSLVSASAEAGESPDLTTFDSAELGVSFDYPSSYTLDSHADGADEQSWTTLTLVDSKTLAEYENSDASEGPPAITVQVFDNPKDYSVEDWIDAVPQSNYQLATDTELLEGEVGGEPARAYAYSGLYENNAIVVAHAGKMYLFTVAWTSQNDENINVLGDLLDSVQFN